MSAGQHALQPGTDSRIDRGLRWTLFGVVLVALAILVYGTVAVYRDQPPIPDRVVTTDGEVLYTAADIRAGKELFQREDLMDFGSLYGNGAYFGPDWNTDYLIRERDAVREAQSAQLFGREWAALDSTEAGAVDEAVANELKQNRFADGALVLTDAQATAYRASLTEYRSLFRQGDPALGLPANVLADDTEVGQMTAFLGWTSWTSVALRPGTDHSYTNNWPYEPSVGNQPTEGLWLWTWASLAGTALLLLGAVWVYRRLVAPHPAAEVVPATAEEAQVSPTPSQRWTWAWFLIVPVLLLLQGLVGTLIAHYYAERQGFFGMDLTTILPFHVVRAWHLQLAIAWIAAAWLGAGLFLAPLIGGREPKLQRFLTIGLLAAVVVVVLGALVGVFVGVMGDIGPLWFWFGNQGLEYIQLGRVFQIGLFVGLIVWAAVLVRAFWPGLRAVRSWTRVEHLLAYAAASIGLVYAFGMIPPLAVEPSPTITDYWRWWVVHLWVEGTFEFFTVAAIGYVLLRMRLVPRQLVERIVYFELILVLGSGMVGMGHHFYWIGEPALWVALGGMFSMAEVIPLIFLVVRAWHELRLVRAAGDAFPQKLAFGFITAASAWNFVGAGVLGGVINPPIVSYFEHGQFLTSAHGHASMFGAFGMLALGLVYFAVRSMLPAERWSDRLGTWALYAFNAAIVLWLVLNLLPVGVLQIAATINEGFAYARSLAFYDGVVFFQWARLPGDVAYLAGAVLLLADLGRKFWIWRSLRVEERGRVGRAPLPAGVHAATRAH
ncbi:MAG TPA: cbb3-type cytochrome c oxidase subunit I [Candidatus Limnocylindria bacterium]